MKICQIKENKTIKNAIKRYFVKYFSNESNCKKNYDFYKHQFENYMVFRNSTEKFKCFRVMDSKGHIINSDYENIPKDLALKIFTTMIQIRECDIRFNMAQREGKISFYMTCTGEEASTVASTAAMSNEDMIFPQYRESACLLYRGFTIQEMANQLAATEYDNGKGRQMPVHYGSKKLNYQTVSSPLCTQLPHASGCGYHYRVKNLNKVAVTYFGDGAASEGDFHSAMNFAATLNSQTMFICRNNMFAISTGVDEQYKGDGIAIRGLGYGINSIRVDGNDVFAVYNAVKKAREMIIENKFPVLIELMSYRVGDHSTSDFSKMYRNDTEMKKWNEYIESIGNPIDRFYNYLLAKQWITQDKYNHLVDDTKEQVRNSLKNAISYKKPSINSMFDDVLESIPPNLIAQRNELKEHLSKYSEYYPLSELKD